MMPFSETLIVAVEPPGIGNGADGVRLAEPLAEMIGASIALIDGAMKSTAPPGSHRQS